MSLLEINIDEENSDYTAKQIFIALSKQVDDDYICEVIVSMSTYLSNTDKLWVKSGINNFILKEQD